MSTNTNITDSNWWAAYETDSNDDLYLAAARDRKLFDEIREKAKVDPILRELLYKCIVYYQLTKENNNGS